MYKKRSLESSETPVLYRGRTLPKGKQSASKYLLLIYNTKPPTTSHKHTRLVKSHFYIALDL